MGSINVRLARLERAVASDPRMTAAEIDEAAIRYEAELRSDGVLGGGTIIGAVIAWRSAVERAGDTWLQRIYADMAPADFYA